MHKANQNRTLLLATVAFTVPSLAFAQSGNSGSQGSQYGQSGSSGSHKSTHKVVTPTLLGRVKTFKTNSSGRIHIQASTSISNADYFRGGYDNVEEDFDSLSYAAGIDGTVELLNNRRSSFLNDLNLGFGTANSLSTSDHHPRIDNGNWYESNWYVGLGARLNHDWLASLTYSIYTIPIDDSEPYEDVAGALKYTGNNLIGSLKPEINLAVTVDGKPAGSMYSALSIKPSKKFRQGTRYPVTWSFPMLYGVGINDYYGKDSHTGTYFDPGTAVSVPLAFIPSGYGKWKAKAKFEVLVRDHNLRDASPSYADNTAVPMGTLSLSLAY